MRVLLSIIIFTVVSLGSFAQIVNMENQRITDSKQGLSGLAELNFNFTMNTKQVFQIGSLLRVGYVKKKHRLLLVGDHSFIQSGNSDYINKGFQHVRYNYTFKDSGRVSMEFFQQGQFNRIQKINLRLLAGSGLRFDLIDKKNYQLILGVGLMGEYEELINIGTTRDILSTNYLSFDGQLTKNVGINTISYFQPKLTDLGIYRFSNETSVRFTINQYLSFRLIYSLNHDNRSLEGVRKTNYVIKNSFRLSTLNRKQEENINHSFLKSYSSKALVA